MKIVIIRTDDPALLKHYSSGLVLGSALVFVPKEYDPIEQNFAEITIHDDGYTESDLNIKQLESLLDTTRRVRYLPSPVEVEGVMWFVPAIFADWVQYDPEIRALVEDEFDLVVIPPYDLAMRGTVSYICMPKDGYPFRKSFDHDSFNLLPRPN